MYINTLYFSHSQTSLNATAILAQMKERAYRARTIMRVDVNLGTTVAIAKQVLCYFDCIALCSLRHIV